MAACRSASAPAPPAARQGPVARIRPIAIVRRPSSGAAAKLTRIKFSPYAEAQTPYRAWPFRLVNKPLRREIGHFCDVEALCAALAAPHTHVGAQVGLCYSAVAV